MGSLFTGTPQTATSYVTSTSETPKWLQDAIYTQIQNASQVAATPFQSYQLPQVAGATPQQEAAYAAVTANQGAWKPTLEAAQTGTQALTTAPGALTAAQPYLTQAGGSSVSNIADYMSPYTQNVTDQIAKLGARNLTENLLPGVSDAFVRSGSFGGTRMGEFGSRALRDTQEAILAQQSQALQSGYGQALGASQADLSRQAGLASTAGGLAGADVARQQSALSQMASMAGQGAQMRAADVGALEAAGGAQQAQQQAQLTSAYNQWLQEQQYPKQQLDWLSTQVRGMAPIAPTSTAQSTVGTGQSYSASPLSQLATGLAAGAGLSKVL